MLMKAATGDDFISIYERNIWLLQKKQVHSENTASEHGTAY